jgi:hypothetical protein
MLFAWNGSLDAGLVKRELLKIHHPGAPNGVSIERPGLGPLQVFEYTKDWVPAFAGMTVF